MRKIFKLALNQVERIGLAAPWARQIGVVSGKWNGRGARGLANKSLLDSARIGDEKGLARALAEGANVETRARASRNAPTDSMFASSGYTAAMVAAKHGSQACLGLLVAAGADVNAKNRHGWTASMFACSNGNGGCLGLLLAAGANMDAKADYGWTAAMWAAGKGEGACLSLLGAAGACVDAKDEDGWTPAMWAAVYGRQACMELLIAAGADIEAKSNEGRTAASLAASNGHQKIAALLDALALSRRESAEISMSAGAGHRLGRGSMRV